ncbi:DELLA protein GAI1-like [Durio zibethinus]|uniref:DELLA protein GAI1-like n=1 Tax=Durio zibethinus TaxID=66656 RepID=A0A6P5X2R2_DURZI|nr:DELLA protein GAI1-like [Durio zibethinus]
MVSSAFPVLLDCARAIEDGDLKLADSLLKQIWTLTVYQPNEQQSNVVKYFAEALVRRAYGLHPDFDNFKLQMGSPLDFLYWYIPVEDAIKKAVVGKKRVHLVDFRIPHLYGCLISPYLANLLSVRVSVILPRSLKKIVNVQEEQQYVTVQAKIYGVRLEKLEVVYANSLKEVDASMLDFRRTEDEAVVFFYFFKLCTLLTEAGVMEREMLKLRDIKPDIVIIQEHDANYNHSDFITRFEDSFQYYSHVFRLHLSYKE